MRRSRSQWSGLAEFTRRYFHGATITVTPDHYVSYGPSGDVWGDADVLETGEPLHDRLGA